jgi:catechol 2,3-dioxygenase-like lactoylglutathione lyase family enzyme
MARMHIHISVDKLEDSIKFYSALFGVQPTKQKDDYAKWMLDSPKVNFAISSRGAETGIDHLGLQAENEEEMEGLRERIKKADISTFNEGETVCCYAKSDKSWVEDPSGIAWETYHTMEDAEFFNNPDKESDGSSCCVPNAKEDNKSSCCEPKSGCC